MIGKDSIKWCLSIARIGMLIFLSCAAIHPTNATAQTTVLPPCEYETWRGNRDELGGYYLAHSSNNGFINILRMTAINGSIQGYLFGTSLEMDGSYERFSFSISGLYDDTQVSFSSTDPLHPFTAIGTWGPVYLHASWIQSDGSIANSFFQPIKEADANRIVEEWPQHDARSVNAGLQIEMMKRVASDSPYQIDLVQEIDGIAAASYLGFRDADEIDLLLFGWLASVQFSEHDPDLGPNQSNWYNVHTFHYQTEAENAASCAQEQRLEYGGSDFELVSGTPPGSRIWTNTESNPEGIYAGNVVAIHGSNVITASIYGDEAMRSHGFQMVIAMIEDIGEIR